MTRPHTCQQLIEGVALTASTKERWLRGTIRHGTRRAPSPSIGTGRRVRGEVTVIMAIAGCKIAEELEGGNLPGLLQQLGVPP